tara:strand:+ start:7747 stop:8655 length:909 start_codon:yes stop_codon:yes gene_type:complete
MVNSDIITNVSILTVLAFVCGYFVYYISKDKEWVFFNFYIFGTVLATFLLLKYSRYVLVTTLTLIFMLIAVFFLFFKVDLNYSFSKESINNNGFYSNLKNNLGNANIFFWMLFIASFITLIGLILANRASYIMSYKESPIGDAGDQGSIGKIGKETMISSKYDIAYAHMLDSFNTVIQSKDSNNNINNIFIKEHLKNICYSLDFKKELLAISNTDKYKQNNKDDNMAVKMLVDYLVIDATHWAKRFILYSNGEKFLTSPFLNKDNWDILYVKNDKINNLDKNYDNEMTKISSRWKWGFPCDN